jgi:hypothetical protein
MSNVFGAPHGGASSGLAYRVAAPAKPPDSRPGPAAADTDSHGHLDHSNKGF